MLVGTRMKYWLRVMHRGAFCWNKVAVVSVKKLQVKDYHRVGISRVVLDQQPVGFATIQVVVIFYPIWSSEINAQSTVDMSLRLVPLQSMDEFSGSVGGLPGKNSASFYGAWVGLSLVKHHRRPQQGQTR